MFCSRGTVRYEERGREYRDVEKVGKHCSTLSLISALDGSGLSTPRTSSFTPQHPRKNPRYPL